MGLLTSSGETAFLDARNAYASTVPGPQAEPIRVQPGWPYPEEQNILLHELGNYARHHRRPQL